MYVRTYITYICVYKLFFTRGTIESINDGTEDGQCYTFYKEYLTFYQEYLTFYKSDIKHIYIL